MCRGTLAPQRFRTGLCGGKLLFIPMILRTRDEIGLRLVDGFKGQNQPPYAIKSERSGLVDGSEQPKSACANTLAARLRRKPARQA